MAGQRRTISRIILVLFHTNHDRAICMLSRPHLSNGDVYNVENEYYILSILVT